MLAELLTERFAKVLEKQGAEGVYHLRPVRPAEAEGMVADVYAQIGDEYFLAPPFTLHSPVPEILAGMWSAFRENFLAGRVARTVKEAVATAVSRSNRCPFCVESHVLSVRAEAGREAARAIEAGRHDAIEDPQIRDHVRWAESTRLPGSEILAHPPFSREDAPEIIGTALIFHYLNRMVNVFCEDSPMPLLPALGGLRGFVQRMSSPVVRGVLEKPYVPGTSLSRLPRAEIPDDLAWAAPNPPISAAFAGFAETVEQRVQDHVPEGVRAVVREKIDAWRGEDPGLGRDWLEEAVAPLDEGDRPAAQLALLTALASYRVDEVLIRSFREHHPDDVQLVVLASWASFRRRSGSAPGSKAREGDPCSLAAKPSAFGATTTRRPASTTSSSASRRDCSSVTAAGGSARRRAGMSSRSRSAPAGTFPTILRTCTLRVSS